MTSERMLELYRCLYTIRRVDEMCLELKFKDLIMNGFHPYAGEEAVAVGVCDLLRPDDAVLSTHRPQGHSLARGSTPRQVFCEMLGRRGGMSQGIGGPMQWIDAPNRFFCGSIVGSGITIAAGVGLAMKRAGKGQVCVCFFGDGASNTGSFHEGLNLAAIWKLPVVYVCENNQYGEAMPVAEFVAGGSIAARGAAYGLQGITADGMDVASVLEATTPAIERCREDDGPVLIEFETYRFRGHYGGDPEHTYRTREEVQEWRKRCPVMGLRQRLLDAGVPADDLAGLEAGVDADLADDQAWALEQPFPTVAEATDHVLAPL